MSKARDDFKPGDFRTDKHYWDTFDHSETEVSACWIVMFLQDRGAGWDDFTVGQIRAYYKRMREQAGKTDDGFTFNRLILGSHTYMTARSFPLGELRDNKHVIEMVGKWSMHGHPNNVPDDVVCVITDAFIEALAKNPELRKTA